MTVSLQITGNSSNETTLNHLPPKFAFAIAGTQSGCGKTTLSLALMAAFRARKLQVQPFKVGPDFIDPGLHAHAAQAESRNLDGWMLTRAYNRELFRTLLARSDMAIVEGVMGLYDGYDGIGEAGSTAEMCKWLDLPVILVVDARSMARSAAALVYGFQRFDPRLKLAGVVFNRIGSEGHLRYLKQAMAANLPDVPVLGGIPREDMIKIPERHLGLVTADEFTFSREWKSKLIDMVERHLDLQRILQVAEHPPLEQLEGRSNGLPQDLAAPVVVAVARDAAFCFYYADNLELLRQAGAEIRFFSPLAGETFPADADGLYLGGGYPELFAERLSRNERFLSGVRRAVQRGMPVYAECGGLMTLSQSIETIEGESYPMAGVFAFATRMLSKRKALGYTEVELRRPCLLGGPGQRLRGHEFHYSEIVNFDGSELDFAYELHGRSGMSSRLEGYSKGSVLASYIHLHWGSLPRAASAFVRACEVFRLSKKASGPSHSQNVKP